jgi:hypothetical protein
LGFLQTESRTETRWSAGERDCKCISINVELGRFRDVADIPSTKMSEITTIWLNGVIPVGLLGSRIETVFQGPWRYHEQLPRYRVVADIPSNHKTVIVPYWGSYEQKAEH